MKIIDSLRVALPKDLDEGEIFLPAKGLPGKFVIGTAGDGLTYLVELDGEEPFITAPVDEFHRGPGLIATEIDFEVDTDDFEIVHSATASEKGRLLLTGDTVAVMGITSNSRFPVVIRGGGPHVNYEKAASFKHWRIVRYRHGKAEVLFEV